MIGTKYSSENTGRAGGWKNGLESRGNLAFVIVLLLLMWGCTETIDMELKSTNRRLVVDGMLTNEEKMHYIRLSESVPFFQDSASPVVSDAEVIISDGDRIERLHEASEMPGFYLTSQDFAGVPGRNYTLTVRGVDIDDDGQTETYRASSTMPEPNQADSIDVVYDEKWDIWKVLLYATDNPDKRDYYMFRVFRNGGLISDNITEFSLASDQFFDGNRAAGVWVQSIDASNENHPMEPGDVITLQMCTIGEAYYNFIDGVQRENRQQYPLFSGPPANAPGNVNCDALGFFPAFSVSYASFLFDEETIREQE
ncbi:MAG: DUF4249 domain-containing protein [Marinilabiliaceae bacterium]